MNKSRLLIPVEFRAAYNPELKLCLKLKTVKIELDNFNSRSTSQLIFYISTRYPTTLDHTAFTPFRQPRGSIVGNFMLYASFANMRSPVYDSCKLIFESLGGDKITDTCSQIEAYLLSLRYCSSQHAIVLGILRIVSKL
jgi:hypothetical protein